jgi:hypothetical protein
MIASAVRRFYSWHFASVRRTRSFIVLPDSLPAIVVITLFTSGLLSALTLAFRQPTMHLLLGSVAVALISPLFAWQFIVVSVEGVSIWRTLLVVPYWVTKIPPGIPPELYEAYEDTGPSSVAYRHRDDYVHIGNGWNARALFALLGQIAGLERSNNSLERTPNE